MVSIVRALALQVIHTAGPVWKGGVHDEKKDLYEAVAQALKEANKRNFSTVRTDINICKGDTVELCLRRAIWDIDVDTLIGSRFNFCVFFSKI